MDCVLAQTGVRDMRRFTVRDAAQQKHPALRGADFETGRFADDGGIDRSQFWFDHPPSVSAPSLLCVPPPLPASPPLPLFLPTPLSLPSAVVSSACFSPSPLPPAVLFPVLPVSPRPSLGALFPPEGLSCTRAR